MKNVLDTVEQLDEIIRQLHKIDSKMQSGQFIGAYRDIRRMISYFGQTKIDLVASCIPGETPKKIKSEEEL